MANSVYLLVMTSIILAVAAVSVPGLFRKRCPSCGAWNALEAGTCKNCPHVFPEDGP